MNRAPGTFFFLKTAGDEISILVTSDSRQFSCACSPDGIDFRVYSIKRRGAYWVLALPMGRLFKGGVYLKSSYFVKTLTLIYDRILFERDR